MLGGEVTKGDTVTLRWDAQAEQVVIEPRPAPAPGPASGEAGAKAAS
jgi:hypothetical protein